MIDQADNVSSQLEKFRHAYAFIVVGQRANLDFWLGQAEHALAAIDGYKVRFERMAQAQKDWIERHDTKVGSYCPVCESNCELEEKFRRPNPPRRIPSAQLEAAVRRLRDAVYHFLVRCYSLELLDEPALRAACDRVDTSVEPTDLD